MTTNEPTGETATETEYPGFETERLTLDVEEATDVIHETLEGLSATATDDGLKFRTASGTVIAILTETDHEEPAVDLHYRTRPSSSTVTLKARKLRRVLESHTK